MQTDSTPVLAKQSRVLYFKLPVLVFLSLVFCSLPVLAAEWIYTVKTGDNLWELSEDYLIDIKYWRRLQQMNKVKEPTQMPPGSKLRIPLAWTKISPADAKVSDFMGQVRVIREGSEQPVSLEMPLLAGDEVYTEADASITLIFGDGSQLILREEGRLKLDQLEFYGNKGVFNTQIKLKSGRTENQVNPDKKPDSRFEIHTPSATAVVRGTTYRLSVPEQTITSTEVLTGHVGVANDKGQTEAPGGYGVVAKLNTPPTPPIVLLNAPDLSELPQLIEQLPIRMSLPEIEKAQSYRILVAEDPSFKSLFYDGVSPTTTASIAEMPDGNYLMKVRGIDKDSLEGFDSIHSFTLNAKPKAPFLVAPSSESEIPFGHKDFSWSENKDISIYHFQLADNDKFSRPLIDDVRENEGSSIHLNESLSPGKWFWRVAAIDSDEGTGPFGEINTLRVMRPGPIAVEPLMEDADITFRWAEGQPDDQYQIQIAHDEAFDDLVVDQRSDVAEYRLPMPEGSTAIYMRTKLIGSDGFEGSWSPAQFLEIPDKPPYWLGVLPFLFLL